MAHRLTTDSYPGSGTEIIQRPQIGVSSREKHVVVRGFGGAEESKFIELVIYPRFTQDCCQDEAARWKPDGQSVWASGSIDVICRFSATAARHIFRYDIRLSRNMFLQIG